MFNEWILIRFNPLFPGVSWRDGLKSCRTVSYWNLSEFNLSQIWPWLFLVLWRVRGYPKSLRNWRDLEARFHSVHLRTHTLTYVLLHLHMYLIVFTCTIPEVFIWLFYLQYVIWVYIECNGWDWFVAFGSRWTLWVGIWGRFLLLSDLIGC